MPSIYIKPNINRLTKALFRVRMPGNPLDHLPPDGALVEKSSYWMRRLRDGSVVLTEPPKSSAKSTKQE